jgi:hypothetical protein
MKTIHQKMKLGLDPWHVIPACPPVAAVEATSPYVPSYRPFSECDQLLDIG